MTRLEFEDLSFEDSNGKIKVDFLKCYYFYIEKKELEQIGTFTLKKYVIKIDAPEKKVEKRFNSILSRNFGNLKSKLTNRKTIYIHKGSGIPLIGNNAFGVIDRNTSLIEVKPCTGCNLNCIYCSVDEGKLGKWVTDFLVEPGYIVEEFSKLVDFKGVKVEAHIGTQGEPFLYPKIIELVNGLSSIKGVGLISIDTNGTLLTKGLIDKLAKAGLSRVNLSLNSLDPKIASRIAGVPYNLKHVLEMARYTLKKMDLLIAPIWLPGINDNEIPKLIELSKELDVRIGIQNFLNYKYGRNPVKAMNWAVFKDKMSALEKKYSVKLLFTEQDFEIKKTIELPKPFKKGQVVKAKVVCDGRLKNERIAVVDNRNISIPNCFKTGTINVKITRDKHNIFFGRCLG